LPHASHLCTFSVLTGIITATDGQGKVKLFIRSFSSELGFESGDAEAPNLDTLSHGFGFVSQKKFYKVRGLAEDSHTQLCRCIYWLPLPLRRRTVDFFSYDF